MKRSLFSAILAMIIGIAAHAAPYTQHQNVVFGESHGVGLLMDVFVPSGAKNGAAIVDIASGAWHSDRGKIRDHMQAQVYDILCKHGYTVFAVRPGSVSRFTGEDMLEHMHRAIRFVKSQAADYGFDPERLGLMGASAGGHLAAMTALKPVAGNPDAKDPIEKFGSDVRAVGIFFPPTLFVQWGDSGDAFLERTEFLLFKEGINGKPKEEVRAKAEALSPALQVNGSTPPFLIWHGDADNVVPLQQSEVFVEKLKEAGTDVEFHIKPGGGHPWLTISQEVGHMAEWFNGKLGVGE